MAGILLLSHCAAGFATKASVLETSISGYVVHLILSGGTGGHWAGGAGGSWKRIRLTQKIPLHLVHSESRFKRPNRRIWKWLHMWIQSSGEFC